LTKANSFCVLERKPPRLLLLLLLLFKDEDIFRKTTTVCYCLKANIMLVDSTSYKFGLFFFVSEFIRP